jgi:hypothetical protein
MFSDCRKTSDSTISDNRILLSESDEIRRYPVVGNERTSPVSDYRSASCRIRLSDNVGFSRIRWGSFDLGTVEPLVLKVTVRKDLFVQNNFSVKSVSLKKSCSYRAIIIRDRFQLFFRLELLSNCRIHRSISLTKDKVTTILL